MENMYPTDTEEELFVSCTQEILDNIKQALQSAKSIREQHQWQKHKLVVERILEKRLYQN